MSNRAWVILSIGGFILIMGAILRVLAGSIPGVRVTSWWRTPARNTAVGGTYTSRHLFGWAVDIVPVRADVEARLRSLLPFVLNEGDHLHAAWF